MCDVEKKIYDFDMNLHDFDRNSALTSGVGFSFAVSGDDRIVKRKIARIDRKLMGFRAFGPGKARPS